MLRSAALFTVLAVLGIAACGDDTSGAGGAGGAGAAAAGTGASSGAGAGTGSATGSSSGDPSATSTGDPSATGTGSAGGGTSSGTGGGPPAPCGEFPTFEDGLSPTSEIHVATNGDDGGGDGSAGAPFATLDRALSAATPGAAVVLHAGTHAGDAYAEGLAGTADAPIWIGGAAGDARPIIEGGVTAMHLSGARYVIVHDLEITGTEQDGINIDDGGDYANEDAARYVVVRDVAIHDVGAGGNEDCLKLSGVNDFWVLRAAIARCGGAEAGSGIDQVGCHRGTVAASTFEEMAGNGVQCKGGSADVTIVANRFIDGGGRAVNMGGSTGFEFFRPPLSQGSPNAEARNIRVSANLFVRGPSAAGFVGCGDCLAANNTIIDPEHWVFRILQETTSSGGYTFLPASGGRVVNNLVHFRDAVVTEHVNVGAETDGGSLTFTTNLWYAFYDPRDSAPILPVAETGGVVGTAPGFVDEPNGDYHLAGESPASDAGTAVAEATGDLDGACFAAPPSIGAYEGSAP